MSGRQQVFNRWEIFPSAIDDREWWSSFGNEESVMLTLRDWQTDHPDWNPDANIQEDAEVIWEWITEELQ